MFTIGLSFPNAADKNTSPLNAAFASSDHTAITSWPTGAAIGTKDGSVFIFKARPPHKSEPSPAKQDVHEHLPTPLPLSVLSSRSASPTLSAVSTSHAPFNVTSRPRVVSGVTREKAEAPKNYVDYDDEPGKLKNLLQGRAIREGATKHDYKWASSPKSPLSPQFPQLAPDKPKRSLDSGAEPTTTSISTRQHPSLAASSRSNDFNLCCMVTLPWTSRLAGVADLVALEDARSICVLQESGALTIISNTDGTIISSSDMNSDVHKPGEHNKIWIWTRIHAFKVHEEFAIFTTARQDERSSYALNDKPGDVQTRIVTFVYNSPEDIVPRVVEKLNDAVVPGPESCVTLIQDAIQGIFVVFHVDINSQIICRRLRLNLHILTPPITETQEETPSRSIHNPFKKARHPENTSKDHEVSRVEWLGVANFGCVMSNPKGIFVHSPRRAIIYSENCFCVLAFKGDDALPLHSQETKGLVRVVYLDEESYCLLFKDRLTFYSDVAEPRLQYSVSARQLSLISHSGDFYLHYYRKGGYLERIDVTQQNPGSVRLYPLQEMTNTVPRITSILPIDLTEMILGFSDGRIERSSFVKMCGMAEDSHHRPIVSDVALGGSIIALFPIQDTRSNERLLVGGADDGSCAIWNSKTLELRARWVIFTTRLYKVIHGTEPAHGSLQGCILCISMDGTIAVIVLDGFQLLYLIPGSPFPLERLCISGNDLLLFYSDYRARLWDIRTHEFWRSLTEEKAEELLGQGDWITMDVKRPEDNDGVICRNFSQQWLLEMNVERFITESNTLTRSISTNKIQTRLILDVLTRLKAILSVLVTPGLDPDIDNICENRIGTVTNDVMVGTYGTSHGGMAVYGANRSAELWCISPDVSASRAIGLILVLRALSLFEECAEDCATVIAFYATSLGQAVGPNYQLPSLIYLARRWFNGSNETRGAIRTLLDAALMRLPDDEAASLVDKWQHYLPCLQPSAGRETESAMLALFICGHIAAEKYSLLSTGVLTDVAKSISIYMTTGPKALGIELCARGFHVWEHYIDSMELLRSLFNLATTRGNKDKDGTLARNAVLQIATKSTPTFMTTLGLDIQSPTSIEHRKSVLQIVAVLIRKRPGVLEPNLPRLMEAVVKSLDPNSTTGREAVLDTATEILKHVVDTFPTVDFDTHSQRLAVGTCEGVVVMYDLKTAIRLYVLEGHHEPVTAVSFSEDGRRLVTVAVAEGLVLVWKVGTGFSNLFSAGGGHKPFKQFPFEMGRGGGPVKTEWTGARSCRVHVGEVVLGFST